MKVCLLIPPSPFLLDERVFMSLGVLKVAGSLEQAGHKVDVLDLSGVTNYEEVVDAYAALHPEVYQYGITATTPQMPAAFRIAKRLPSPAMIGGPHPTLVLAALKIERSRGIEGRAAKAMEQLMSGFHCVVAGDGEKAIHRALDAKAKQIVVDADDPGADLFLTSKMFAESGWPARHLIDVESYHYFVDGERALSIVSQLGCPMKCTFCAGRNSPMLRRMRVRPPEDAVAEIVHLYEQYGFKGCMFYDDELNISRGMLDLMAGLKREGDLRGIEWRLRGFLKAELFTDEQAEAMHQAGFRQVLIGFEAGHPRILENIQKNATVEDNTRAMQIAARHGLKVKALMSVGHPGESEETVLAVRDWLLEVKPSDFDVTIITPYPGSPYYDEGVRWGDDGTYCYTAPHTQDRLFMEDVDFSKDAAYYKGIPGEYISHVWTDHLMRERLVKLRDQVEDEVRTKLGIPFNQSGAQMSFEHSMGQGGSLPRNILRSSK